MKDSIIDMKIFDSNLRLTEHTIFIFLYYLNKIKNKIDQDELKGLKILKNLYQDANNNKTHKFHDLSIFKNNL